MTVCASLQWEFNSQDYCTDCTFRLSFSIDFNSFCWEEIRPKLCLSYAHTILVEVPPEHPSSHFIKCSPQQQQRAQISIPSLIAQNQKRICFFIFRCHNITGIQFCPLHPPVMPTVTPMMAHNPSIWPWRGPWGGHRLPWWEGFQIHTLGVVEVHPTYLSTRYFL